MNVCKAWSCCCGEFWSKRVLPLRRKLVKEQKGAWRRRIYRKYASCKWLKDAGLEFTRADVVVSISRGPPGQWFPETEHWASAIQSQQNAPLAYPREIRCRLIWIRVMVIFRWLFFVSSKDATFVDELQYFPDWTIWSWSLTNEVRPSSIECYSPLTQL